MPFLSQLEQEISTFEGWKLEIYKYLLANAKGRANAVTWAEIADNCDISFDPYTDVDHSKHIERRTFNFDLIAESRESGIFICSSDKDPKGYWIATCMADVVDMRDWYKKRLETLGDKLSNLDRFVAEEFGAPDDTKFCGGCIQVSPTEEEQDNKNHPLYNKSHMCLVHKNILLHMTYHPQLVRLSVCKGAVYELKYLKERKAKIKCIKKICQFWNLTAEYGCSKNVDFGGSDCAATFCQDYLPNHNIVDN